MSIANVKSQVSGHYNIQPPSLCNINPKHACIIYVFELKKNAWNIFIWYPKTNVQVAGKRTPLPLNPVFKRWVRVPASPTTAPVRNLMISRYGIITTGGRLEFRPNDLVSGPTRPRAPPDQQLKNPQVIASANVLLIMCWGCRVGFLTIMTALWGGGCIACAGTATATGWETGWEGKWIKCSR